MEFVRLRAALRELFFTVTEILYIQRLVRAVGCWLEDVEGDETDWNSDMLQGTVKQTEPIDFSETNE